MLEARQTIEFPKPKGLRANMMPIVMGAIDSIPHELRGYFPIMDECRLRKGDTVYLTAHESFVEEGKTQRRPGVHTDGTDSIGWGGWGGNGGIYIASTDGECIAWDVETYDVDHLGSLKEPPVLPGTQLEANTLYCISDRTPHTSVPAKEGHYRQFFRLIGPDIGAWWEQHSTPNPLGVKPKAPIFTYSKFEA